MDKVTEVKSIDIKAGHFMANGKKYIITNKVTGGRRRMLEKIKIKLGTGLYVGEFFETIKKIEQNLVDERPLLVNIAEARQICLNTMHLTKEMVEGSNSPFMEFAAIFINTEGEDVRDISQEQINEKISDWEIEGYNHDDFFFFATSSVNGLMSHYKELRKLIESITLKNH